MAQHGSWWENYYLAALKIVEVMLPDPISCSHTLCRFSWHTTWRTILTAAFAFFNQPTKPFSFCFALCLNHMYGTIRIENQKTKTWVGSMLLSTVWGDTWKSKTYLLEVIETEHTEFFPKIICRALLNFFAFFFCFYLHFSHLLTKSPHRGLKLQAVTLKNFFFTYSTA